VLLLVVGAVVTTAARIGYVDQRFVEPVVPAIDLQLIPVCEGHRAHPVTTPPAAATRARLHAVTAAAASGHVAARAR
jgi:hypothetical protein